MPAIEFEPLGGPDPAVAGRGRRRRDHQEAGGDPDRRTSTDFADYDRKDLDLPGPPRLPRQPDALPLAPGGASRTRLDQLWFDRRRRAAAGQGGRPRLGSLPLTWSRPTTPPPSTLRPRLWNQGRGGLSGCSTATRTWWPASYDDARRVPRVRRRPRGLASPSRAGARRPATEGGSADWRHVVHRGRRRALPVRAGLDEYMTTFGYDRRRLGARRRRPSDRPAPTARPTCHRPVQRPPAPDAADSGRGAPAVPRRPPHRARHRRRDACSGGSGGPPPADPADGGQPCRSAGPVPPGSGRRCHTHRPVRTAARLAVTRRRSGREHGRPWRPQPSQAFETTVGGR